MGSKNRDGYGNFTKNAKSVGAHRISWEIHFGPIPNGQHVLHICDNPECTNPKHLRLGNHLENMRDMFKKNRRKHATGANNGLAKLNPSKVRKIRKLYGKLNSYELADMFGVSRPSINAIINRHTWKHV